MVLRPPSTSPIGKAGRWKAPRFARGAPSHGRRAADHASRHLTHETPVHESARERVTGIGGFREGFEIGLFASDGKPLGQEKGTAPAGDPTPFSRSGFGRRIRGGPRARYEGAARGGG